MQSVTKIRQSKDATNAPSFLCGVCTKAHSINNLSRHHTVLMIDDMKESNVDSFTHTLYCREADHEQEKLTQFCLACEAVICRHCAADDHGGHEVKSCNKIIEARRDEVMKTMESVEEMMKQSRATGNIHRTCSR